jgi:Na+/melibiose symporter-like transporter
VNKFGGLSYYVSRDQGMSLTELQYWECILALLISFLLAIALKYWASLVTNRDLLQKLLTMLLFYGTFQFIMTLWCLCTLFLVFKSVDWAVRLP